MNVLQFDDEANARYLDDRAARKGLPFGALPDPGFFQGAGSAPLNGLMRGIVAKPAKLVGDAAKPVVRPMAKAIDEAFGTSAVSDYFEGEFRKNDQLLDDLRADPQTTGLAGQVLHGLFDIGGSAITFTPAGASVLEGYARQQELMEKGVNPVTATAAGTVSGLSLYAGVKAPMTMGKAAVGRGTPGAAANVAVGAGTNMTAGVAERGLTSNLLAGAGYTEMAAQYQAFDRQSLLTEFVLGSLLSGGAGAIEARSARREAALDAALAARNNLHAVRDTAPGAPVDAKSAALHKTATDVALEQALRGEPVNVPASITEGTFLRRAMTSGEGDVAAAIREVYHDDLPAGARFAPSERLAQMLAPERRGLRFDAPELNEYAAAVEQKYGLPGGLINALKNAGERSGSQAVSPKGARGVMQFMPENLKKYGVEDASDPAQLIDAAGRYLRDTMRQYDGNIDAVIADYNGGPRQARRVLNGEQPAAAETRAYLARVREYLGRAEQGLAERRRGAEEFAVLRDRVVDLDPDTGAPTFRDGTAYDCEEVLAFYDREVAQQPVGAELPDVLFEVGRVDGTVAEGLQQFLPEFDGGARVAELAAPVIRHIQQLQPEVARDLLARIEDGVLYADEVLPNPVNRSNALLVLRDQDAPAGMGTLFDVGVEGGRLQVRAAMRAAEDTLTAARQLKAEIEAANPRPERSAPVAGRVRSNPASGINAQGGQNRTQGVQTVRGGTEGRAGDSSAPEAREGRGAGEEAEAAYVDRDARDIVGSRGDMLVTLDDGSQVTAREALVLADEAILQARGDVRAFEAAVTCFLRRGA